MTGRCATCKWFVPWKQSGISYGADRPDDWGVCTLITAERDMEYDEDAPQGKAFLMQQWSEHSDLVVSPDFGCVEHEPRGDE